MLWNTSAERQYNSELQSSLFKDLSRILPNLGRVPLPRIRSFIIDRKGALTLTNHPLSIELRELENENIPTDIPYDFTY